MFQALKYELNKRSLLMEQEEIDDEILIDEMDEDLIDDEEDEIVLDEAGCKKACSESTNVEDMLNLIPEYVIDNQDYDLDELLEECMFLAESKDETAMDTKSDDKKDKESDKGDDFSMSEEIDLFGDCCDDEEDCQHSILTDFCCDDEEDDCNGSYNYFSDFTTDEVADNLFKESTTLKGLFLTK